MLTSWLDVAPVAKQDSTSVPLWVPFAVAGIAFLAGVLGPLVATRMTNKQQDRTFQQQMEWEHQQWLRQKKVETYELVLRRFRRYRDWRLDHRNVLSSLRFGHFIDIHRLVAETSEMYQMCLMYAPMHICLLVEEMTEPALQLMESDRKRMVTGRGLPLDLPEEYTRVYNRLETAIREDIQSLRTEDHSKPADEIDK